MIDVGMNWIDVCTIEEVKIHNRALKGRRDKMYLACSWYEREMRSANGRAAKALLVALAVKERKEGKELTSAERTLLRGAMQHAWANLPPGYEWLRDWEYV